MSNVEYRCTVCGNRLFALPGGTKLKCPRSGGTIIKDGQQQPHGESEFVQVEGYGGPDFQFIDEDGVTSSRDAVVGQEKLRVATSEQVAGADIDPDAELVAYRAMYESLTGNEVDKRWRVPSIKDQINQHMERMSEEKAAQMVEVTGEPQSNDNSEEVEDPENVEDGTTGEIVDSIPDDDGEDSNDNDNEDDEVNAS